MRLLYYRSNRLVRLFNKCSMSVLIEIYRNFCTTFYCPYFWTHYNNKKFKLHNVSKILGVCMAEVVRISVFVKLQQIVCTIQISGVARNTIWQNWKKGLYILCLNPLPVIGNFIRCRLFIHVFNIIYTSNVYISLL